MEKNRSIMAAMSPRSPITVKRFRSGASFFFFVQYLADLLSSQEIDELWREIETIEKSDRRLPHDQKVFRRDESASSDRYVAAFGDEGISYSYCIRTIPVLPWRAVFRKLRDQVQCFCSHKINYMLINRFANGQVWIGWHSDDEEEIIWGSSIACVTIGEVRELQFKDLLTTKCLR